MRLPGYAITGLLVLMFAVAMGVRTSGTDWRRAPYFKGTASMTYRHAMVLSAGESLRAPSDKANWPDGYVPARYRAAGLETVFGLAHRVARYFGESDGRRFYSRLVVLAAAACVFLAYAFARRLWDCQAAGLLAAGLAACYWPLVGVTGARALSHASFGALLVALHAWLLLRHLRAPSARGALLAAAAAFALAAVWEPGPYVAALAAAVAAAWPGRKRRERVWVAASHAAVLALAALVLPHAAGLRAAGGFPFLEYAAQRLRHLPGKPDSATALPDAVRVLWSSDHAPPSVHERLRFLLPLAFFVAAVALGGKRVLRHRAALLGSAGAAALGVAVWLLDRGAAGIAALAVIPLCALAARDLAAGLRTRAPLVAAGILLVAVDTIAPTAAVNPIFQIARASGTALRDPDRFVWLSMENTESNLVRFVATRTSVRDPILGASDVTALLLAFAGRTSVQLEGDLSRRGAARRVALTRLYYDDPEELRDACRKLRVSYVLYSIDVLLDTSRYSPRYLAAAVPPGPETAAFAMHFFPETLRGFALVFENEHYRLFRVTDEAPPMFLTDHPPVYQYDAFERVGGDLDRFRGRLVELTFTYRDALSQAERGDYGGALRKLDWCIAQAPRFTRARVARANTLTLAGRTEDARVALLEVLEYAPDDEEALYQAAYVHALLGETERARGLLDVFFASATEKALIERARLLLAFLDQGVPVTPQPAPGDTAR
jgi:tetratricopeptide (TPR) repeat protein